MTDALLVTEVVPPTLASFDVATAEGKDELRLRYARAGAQYMRLNMITSITGAAVGSDGTSETLTSRVDRGILGVIRADADVVLVGAQTVRAEGYVVPRTARLAVVTASGDLSGHRLDLGGGRSRVLIVCAAGRAAAVREQVGHDVELVTVEGDEVEPADVVAALADRGLRRVVCEGGPTLATEFAGAGLIDEYCLTVAPVLEPTPRPFLRLPEGPGPDTEVAGMLVDRVGFAYLRLRARA